MLVNNNSLADTKGPTIEEYFAYKNVFVTGGTGFIGTVLIESLLSSTPDIGKIYLLVRGKYGSDANKRLEKLLSKQVSVGVHTNGYGVCVCVCTVSLIVANSEFYSIAAVRETLQGNIEKSYTRLGYHGCTESWFLR